MKIFNPSHPGKILYRMYLYPLRVSVTEAASALAITRQNLSRIINGKAGISPQMALKLSKAFNTTPEFWLGLQQQYDIWKAERDKVFKKELRKVCFLPKFSIQRSEK